MNKWQETVKRVAKQHPGKSLREILPIAKKEYKNMGHHVAKKSRKGRKGRRSMKGGSDTVTDAITGGGVQAFDGDWNGEPSTVGVGGQGGGSKRRGSKRRGSKRRARGSKRRARGSKRR